MRLCYSRYAVNMIQVKVVNRKLVKPCSPTPQNLKNYKLSFTDEFVLPMELKIGVLLLYASKETGINLEESLAKVLVQFYPLAGRFNMKERCVDCSDQGAEFVEAQAPDVELASLIVERNLGNLDGLFPDQEDEAILSIQITQLKCGGLAIAICISHKIFDASSLGTFVAAWSNASNPRSNMAIINPIFDSASLLPTKNQNNYPNSYIVRETSRIVAKRFTFNEEAIAILRSKLRQKQGKRGMSRVRVVSPFIAKALIGVDRAKHGGVSRPCNIWQAINIRERTIPPLSKHSCGNLAFSSSMDATKEMPIQELVDLMSDAVDKSIAECGQLLSLGEDGLNKLMVEPMRNGLKALQSGEANLVWLTDWSKFGFYQVDYGWGKPVSATVVPIPGENGAVLMENKEGNGIEAWVHLDKNDMALFEQDEEIRVLAT